MRPVFVDIARQVAACRHGMKRRVAAVHGEENVIVDARTPNVLALSRAAQNRRAADG